MTLDERRYTISGIMPPTFQLPVAGMPMALGATDVWIPLDPSPPKADRNSRSNSVYACRKPGVSLEQANADVKRVATVIAANDSTYYRTYTAGVAGLRDLRFVFVGGLLRAPLLILLGGAVLLLLIACANVATLLLARGDVLLAFTDGVPEARP